MKNCLAFQSNTWFQISDWLRMADMRAALRNLLCFHEFSSQKAIQRMVRRISGLRNPVSASRHIYRVPRHYLNLNFEYYLQINFKGLSGLRDDGSQGGAPKKYIAFISNSEPTQF